MRCFTCLPCQLNFSIHYNWLFFDAIKKLENNQYVKKKIIIKIVNNNDLWFFLLLIYIYIYMLFFFGWGGWGRAQLSTSAWLRGDRTTDKHTDKQRNIVSYRLNRPRGQCSEKACLLFGVFGYRCYNPHTLRESMVSHMRDFSCFETSEGHSHSPKWDIL